MKIDRLIGIVTILLQKEKVTTSQLAELIINLANYDLKMFLQIIATYYNGY